MSDQVKYWIMGFVWGVALTLSVLALVMMVVASD